VMWPMVVNSMDSVPASAKLLPPSKASPVPGFSSLYSCTVVVATPLLVLKADSSLQ